MGFTISKSQKERRAAKKEARNRLRAAKRNYGRMMAMKDNGLGKETGASLRQKLGLESDEAPQDLFTYVMVAVNALDTEDEVREFFTLAKEDGDKIKKNKIKKKEQQSKVKRAGKAGVTS